MSDPRTWEDELLSQGKTPKPGASYRCPCCETPAQAFALVECEDGEWRCFDCKRRGGPPAEPEEGWNQARTETPETEPTWDDVRGVRRVLLETSDWSQVADVPEATRLAWANLRQEARDITDLPTPGEAMERLAELRDQGAAI